MVKLAYIFPCSIIATGGYFYAMENYTRVYGTGRFKEKRKTAEISLPLFESLDTDFIV